MSPNGYLFDDCEWWSQWLLLRKGLFPLNVHASLFFPPSSLFTDKHRCKSLASVCHIGKQFSNSFWLCNAKNHGCFRYLPFQLTSTLYFSLLQQEWESLVSTDTCWVQRLAPDAAIRYSSPRQKCPSLRQNSASRDAYLAFPTVWHLNSDCDSSIGFTQS